MRRLRLNVGRPGIAAGAVAVVVLAASGFTWMAASDARTPAQQAANAKAPAPSQITAPVNAGPLVDQFELEAVLKRSGETVITGAAAEGAAKSVVTKVPLPAGSVLRGGEVVVEVSGRPVFVLPGQFPAYRKLVAGVTGPDVRQLQTALRPRFGTPVNGTFDARTRQDVRRLYEAAGYKALTEAVEQQPGDTAPPPPPAVVVPVNEIAFVLALPATVVSVPVQVGADGAAALVVLGAGGWQAVAKLDDQTEFELSKLQGNVPMAVTGGSFSGKPVTNLEIRNAPANSSTTNEKPAREAVFDLGAEGEGRPGDSLRVSVERARSPEGTLVVPIGAIWTGAGKVTQVRVTGASGDRTVTVEILLAAVGYAAVRPVEGTMAVGDSVVLSGPGYGVAK